jgi:Ohr subfamily peroxiredoxin
MNTLYQAEVTAKGGREGHVTSPDGVITMDVRMPEGLGGKGGAYTNPEQLFAAGYSACFDGALNLVARMRKIRLKGSETTAKVAIGKLADDSLGLAVELQVKVPGVEPDVARELLQEAHQVCPYSKATRGNIEVRLHLLEA